MVIDLSEAVCTSRFFLVLTKYFDMLVQRPYCGSVFQLLLANVAQNSQSPQANLWLRALIDAECELERREVLEHHVS